MKKLARHLTVCGFALIWLFYSPQMYTYWYGVEGRPNWHGDMLSRAHGQATDKLLSYVDYLQIDSKLGVYEIGGWGFLEEDVEVQEYTRELILVSETDYLVFGTEPVQRDGVAAHFGRTDVAMSGFKSLLLKHAIPVGSYRLLFSFSRDGEDVFWGDLGHCIERTPNQLLLVDSCQTALVLGMPTRHLLSPQYISEGEISSYVDYLNLHNGEEGVYEIGGWAFLEEDAEVEEYTRELILVSETDYLVFGAEPVRRDDVAAHFGRTDVAMSGFKSLLLKHAIPVGSYRLLFSFSRDGEDVFWGDLGHCIERTPNQLLLVDSC